MIGIPCSENTFDYQTVFQIVVAFEGFSIWKGAKVYKAKEFTNIGSIQLNELDEVAYAQLCNELKGGKKRFRTLLKIAWMLVKHGCRRLKNKTWRSLVISWWWCVRRFHKMLVFILRATPIFTIPALSLSYLMQWGCTSNEFHGGAYVTWFLLLKTGCYFLCWCLAQLLLWHIRVKVPAADDLGIIPPKAP